MDLGLLRVAVKESSGVVEFELTRSRMAEPLPGKRCDYVFAIPITKLPLLLEQLAEVQAKLARQPAVPTRAEAELIFKRKPKQP